MKGKWLCFCCVCITVFICFSPDLRNSLLDWDDAGYIIENTNIHEFTFDTFRWAFSSFYLNYWAPLTWLSLAADYAVWGSNPVGYHLTNNLLHALNSGFFFLISLRLVLAYHETAGKEGLTLGATKNYLLCPLLAAFLFALHPLRVESVAWATERKDVLAMFFGLPAILFYLRYVRATTSALSSRDYWLSIVLFTFSLLSKSLMVTLPAVLLVLDWFPLKRMLSMGRVRVLLEKLPFFMLSAAAAMLTAKAQAVMLSSSDHINLFTRLLNAFKSIWAYLQLTVWPLNLSPFYVHPVTIRTITMEYALPLMAFAGITIFCVLMMKHRPVFMSVWLIYLITLLPFLGFAQSGPQAMAGRFTYLAGLPLALLIAIGITSVCARFAGSRAVLTSVAAGAVLLLLAYGYLTVREIAFWKDDITLWTRVIELSPKTGRAYFQRSHAYFLKRDYQRSLLDMAEAIDIASSKKYRAMNELYRKRALILADMGNYAAAIDDYTRALESATAEIRPMILYERAVAYRNSGRIDLANKDFMASGMMAPIK